MKAFVSQQSTESSCQSSAPSTARSSCSLTSNETGESYWIREEDNREENASSFSSLGLNSPQLVHLTKARAKAPRTHRPRKNRSSKASKKDKTESTFASCTKDNVRNLRARFEQM
ncbi:uncharacterized protein LOC110060043 [Orbicella faveolata]|uniref:uncharacterized protein LOC110060043 n=1 Tax=Orbicella faveolata TaxID=48498 RepID=UPI0009E2BF23|nr:uncharacterized protein LOC110060043 [Orbicella faveolata]